MKKLIPLGVGLILLGFAGCERQVTETPDDDREYEIERRVEQRLAEERLAREEEELARREEGLASRETSLAEQEREIAKRRAELQEEERRREDARSRPAPEPPSHPAADPASYDVFYTRLAPHGQWMEVARYGYVWQPRTATVRGWRPYNHGRWVYTDHGWTWVSAEPFGWAVYHYGRWARLSGIGWVWIPGDQWAPAWVSWRYGEDYVGWAPLPPEADLHAGGSIQARVDIQFDIGPGHYVFIPVRHLGVQEVRQVSMPIEQNITIVNKTVNVTNITRTKNVVINQGPRLEVVQKRSARPIEQMKIRRRAQADQTEPVAKNGMLEIAAPVIEREKSSSPPKLAKKIREAKAERGWEEVKNLADENRIREKIKRGRDARAREGEAPAEPAAARPRDAAPSRGQRGEGAADTHPGEGAAATKQEAKRPAVSPTPDPADETATPEPADTTPAPQTTQ